MKTAIIDCPDVSSLSPAMQDHNDIIQALLKEHDAVIGDGRSLPDPRVALRVIGPVISAWWELDPSQREFLRTLTGIRGLSSTISYKVHSLEAEVLYKILKEIEFESVEIV